MKKTIINFFKAVGYIIAAIVVLDVAYHSFIFNVNEYNQMQESQSDFLKMFPDWIRWLIYDTSKLL